jgi:hypothetical protein
MYDYQQRLAKEAHSLLLLYRIAYLCMAVRTGKTRTAFQAAKLYGAKRVLFVTKLKAISSIQKDFRDVQPGFELFVINYESLHKCEGGWDLVILDECHCLSQYPKPAERTRELKRICAGLPIVYLSGTPSPESYAQFFFQFWVSSFGPWKEYETFYKWHKEYGIPKVKYIYNRQIADYSQVKKEDVLKQVNKFMITYTQEEAGFKAAVEDRVMYVPMPAAVAWAVKKLQKDKVFTTRDGHVVLADTAVKEMQKIHQICSGTVKAESGEAVIFDRSKAQAVADKFKGQRIAIFYKYVAEGIQLRTVFSKVYDDSVEFNKSTGPAVFISQIQSGREGINVSTADCMVMYNIDFSAVSYWQARARLQLKDRVDAAIVWWVFTEGGIEEKIYKVVQGKKDFTLSHYKKLRPTPAILHQ